MTDCTPACLSFSSLKHKKITDDRNASYVDHSIEHMLRQRAYAIAAVLFVQIFNLSGTGKDHTQLSLKFSRFMKYLGYNPLTFNRIIQGRLSN